MAAVQSLGYHTPSALPHLIAEGILPKNPPLSSYTWKVYANSGNEEEVLYTSACVCWSEGRILRKLFNFDAEQEKVQHAILTKFPTQEPRDVNDSSNHLSGLSKALVVVLQNQAHIFFFNGASHIVKLNFEVEHAFAAPRGIILQRKVSPSLPSINDSHSTIGDTLIAPQNSFAPFHTSSKNSKNQKDLLSMLKLDLLKPESSQEDSMPRHFSLTSPLSEFSLVVRSPPGDFDIFASRMTKHLQPLDNTEDIIYVSPEDESPSSGFAEAAKLLIIVTIDVDKGGVSIWNAAYLDSKPVSKAMTGASTPTTVTAMKNRRRSSFLNTGTATPTARPREKSRDKSRESLEPNNSNINKVVPGRRKSKRQEAQQSIKEFEANIVSQVESQIDPRRPSRESRRVSSMISRADLNPSFDRSAFQDLASQHTGAAVSSQNSRRGQSLGNTDRLSMNASQRRLRASTPGAFSRLSIEDVSDLAGFDPLNASQTSTVLDDYEPLSDLSAIEEDAGGFDFQVPQDGLKKEMMARKLTEFSIHISSKTRSTQFNSITNEISSQSFKVVILQSPISHEEKSVYGRRFYIFILNKVSKECVQVDFSFPLRHNSNQFAISGNQFPAPKLEKLSRFGEIHDIIKVSDEHQSRLILLKNSSSSGQMYVSLCAPWSAESVYGVPIKRLRVFNPYDSTLHPEHGRKVTGLRRSLSLPKQLHALLYPGTKGTFDACSLDGKFHRLLLKFWPKNKTISKLMDVLFYSLPLGISEKLLALWWSSYNNLESHPQREWNAFSISIYCLFLSCEDDKRRRRSRKMSVATTTESSIKVMDKLESSWSNFNTRSIPAWSWISQADPILRDSDYSKANAVLTPSKSKKVKPSKSQINIARTIIKSAELKDIFEALKHSKPIIMPILPKIIVALHIMREEMKLSSVTGDSDGAHTDILAPLIAQLGRWLDWTEWEWTESRYYFHEIIRPYEFEDQALYHDAPLPGRGFDSPPSILDWVQNSLTQNTTHSFPTIENVLSNLSDNGKKYARDFTPRIRGLNEFLSKIRFPLPKSSQLVEDLVKARISIRMLETLPESLLAIAKEPIVQCQSDPPTTWDSSLLSYVSREDLTLRSNLGNNSIFGLNSNKHSSPDIIRDIHYISQLTESNDPTLLNLNADRMAVSRLIFNQDRRFTEAVHMIEPYRTAIAECLPSPEWTEAQLLDAQKEVHNWVMTRTFSLAPGLGFTHFDSRVPLLSEKFSIHGYSTLCIMKPLNMQTSIDRSNFTEEKYAWAYFHGGVAAGLSISKSAKGIDSSWIVFNRPHELNNKHAGLLLALGLNGHLKSMAKWLAFKYLTPKHTMTSIGILLGLSASHLGTMDALVTRLLSVHVTRMLPQGAAELNISSLTQTAGLMSIGLLYYKSQHRRMSEVMISEIENMEIEDLSGSTEAVRDEGYRLAAAFALGFINLGQGSDLKGLHDMRLVERLLAIAVGPRQVNYVHLVDQATAGAAIAIMLIFMKTGNKTIARKIDIPDTVAQFDFVRPDVLLLRTLAKHLILWDEIEFSQSWIIKNLPNEYTHLATLRNITQLSSNHMPFYNIMAGLLWSISLRFAGSGNVQVRDFLIVYLDQFIRLCRIPALRYDSRLSRNTVRNCQDLVALSAATVMAGTGDLEVFRRLRSLHGRVNPETPYGSHMAAHMALGALFFGAGCYTFGTNNLAVASLIISFYPVFPMDVTDNKAHLQAFRHFWALAAEARCLIAKDIDTGRAIPLDVEIFMKDHSVQKFTAPQILPEFHTISRICTASTEYWPVTLDFAGNSTHLTTFKQSQTIYVRRRAPNETHSSPFTATLLTANDTRRAVFSQSARDGLFKLKAFADFEMTDFGSLLEKEDRSSESLDLQGGAIDDWLLLGDTAKRGVARDRLWHLRILFAWAETSSDMGDGYQSKWIRKEVLERWKAIVQSRARSRAKARSIL